MGRNLELLQWKQKLFSLEAFWFLSNYAHLWIEYPKNILFCITRCEGCNLFTTNVKNAVIAQTYVSRIRYWKLAQENFEKLKSVEGFKRIITEYPVTEDAYYFYHFLDWVSYIFYLTIFCYKQGYDYIEVGKLCLAQCPNVEFFHSAGGWLAFDHISFSISEIVGIVASAYLKQRPSDTKFLMFDRSIRKFERRHRYESNKWTRINYESLKAECVMTETSRKFRAVSKLDSRRVFPGYKFLITDEFYLECPEVKAFFQETREATSGQQRTEKENEADISAIAMGIYKTVIYGDRYETPVFASNQNAIECTRCISEDLEIALSALSVSEDKIGFTESAGSIDVTKCAFIISERYLRKENAAKKSRSGYKRGIKICSHSQDTDMFVRNLQETLDKNISQSNYRKIDENVLAVYPPDWDYRSKDTQIIVLDTSTEEEDDDLDISEQDIPFNIDCFNTQNTNFDAPHSLGNDESNLRSSTEIFTDMQFVPTSSTGAIPKIKSSVKKKSESRSSKSTKCPQIENLPRDLEKFDPSIFQSETGSISSRNQEQQQKVYTNEDIHFGNMENVFVDLQNCSLPVDPDEDYRNK